MSNNTTLRTFNYLLSLFPTLLSFCIFGWKKKNPHFKGIPPRPFLSITFVKSSYIRNINQSLPTLRRTTASFQLRGSLGYWLSMYFKYPPISNSHSSIGWEYTYYPTISYHLVCVPFVYIYERFANGMI